MNRQMFFALVKPWATERELESIMLAYTFSKLAHQLQRRDEGVRYFEHTRAVALLVMSTRSAKAVILALLHDVLEDTFIQPGFIIRMFGIDIYEGLCLLSNSTPAYDEFGILKERKPKSKREYYAGIRNACFEVRIVKCADRAHNLSTMAPPAWGTVRQAKYAMDTQKHVLPIAAITDAPLYDQLLTRVNSVLHVN